MYRYKSNGGNSHLCLKGNRAGGDILKPEKVGLAGIAHQESPSLILGASRGRARDRSSAP
jgi:hypothetical protein